MEMPPWTSWPVFHVVMEGLKPRFVLPVMLGLALVVVVLRRLLQQLAASWICACFSFWFRPHHLVWFRPQRPEASEAFVLSAAVAAVVV